jgi:hypothetical protein
MISSIIKISLPIFLFSLLTACSHEVIIDTSSSSDSDSVDHSPHQNQPRRENSQESDLDNF